MVKNSINPSVRRSRTRSGCLTCRDRHMKCDELQPICRNCIKSKRECKRGIRLNFTLKTVVNPSLNYMSHRNAVHLAFNPTSDWAHHNTEGSIPAIGSGSYRIYRILDQSITIASLYKNGRALYDPYLHLHRQQDLIESDNQYQQDTQCLWTNNSNTCMSTDTNLCSPIEGNISLRPTPPSPYSDLSARMHAHDHSHPSIMRFQNNSLHPQSLLPNQNVNFLQHQSPSSQSHHVQILSLDLQALKSAYNLNSHDHGQPDSLIETTPEQIPTCSNGFSHENHAPLNTIPRTSSVARGSTHHQGYVNHLALDEASSDAKPFSTFDSSSNNETFDFNTMLTHDTFSATPSFNNFYTTESSSYTVAYPPTMAQQSHALPPSLKTGIGILHSKLPTTIFSQPSALESFQPLPSNIPQTNLGPERALQSYPLVSVPLSPLNATDTNSPLCESCCEENRRHPILPMCLKRSGNTSLRDDVLVTRLIEDEHYYSFLDCFNGLEIWKKLVPHYCIETANEGGDYNLFLLKCLLSCSSCNCMSSPIHDLIFYQSELWNMTQRECTLETRPVQTLEILLVSIALILLGLHRNHHFDSTTNAKTIVNNQAKLFAILSTRMELLYTLDSPPSLIAANCIHLIVILKLVFLKRFGLSPKYAGMREGLDHPKPKDGIEQASLGIAYKYQFQNTPPVLATRINPNEVVYTEHPFSQSSADGECLSSLVFAGYTELKGLCLFFSNLEYIYMNASSKSIKNEGEQHADLESQLLRFLFWNLIKVSYLSTSSSEDIMWAHLVRLDQRCLPSEWPMQQKFQSRIDGTTLGGYIINRRLVRAILTEAIRKVLDQKETGGESLGRGDYALDHLWKLLPTNDAKKQFTRDFGWVRG